MEFSIKLHTIKSGWSIENIEGSQVIISKKYCISFSEDYFVLANSADPEMPHDVAFHLGHHVFEGFLVYKGLRNDCRSSIYQGIDKQNF